MRCRGGSTVPANRLMDLDSFMFRFVGLSAAPRSFLVSQLIDSFYSDAVHWITFRISRISLCGCNVTIFSIICRDWIFKLGLGFFIVNIIEIDLLLLVFDRLISFNL